MPLADALIAELEQEVKTTRTLLGRVPDDKLSWKPHAKSMTLGQLANHIATIPGGVAGFAARDSVDYGTFSPPPQAATAAAILAVFEESAARAKAILGEMDDAALMKEWSLLKGGQTLTTMPRVGIFRYVLLNHLYHHRGQLSVYLRLLDVPVPAIYGPSADENPFG
ncbi:MAG: DinB family protein [Bryobacteraceae bacterium]|jgi:uncharacterized damage-inducible protein DinB